MIIRVVFVVYFLTFLSSIDCSNILLVATAPFPSHQQVFRLLSDALMKNDHNVTIISSDPLGFFAPENLTEVDVGSIYDKYFVKLKPHVDFKIRLPTEWEKLKRKCAVADVYSEYAERIYTHANLQKLLKQELTFDACVVESDYPAPAGIAARYGCRLIVISTSGWPARYLSVLGDNSYVPTEINKVETFVDKLISSFVVLYEKIYYDALVLPREDKIVKGNLGTDTPYLADIQRNTSILLVNRDPVIDPVLPLAPTIVDVGGIYTSREAKPAHLVTN